MAAATQHISHSPRVEIMLISEKFGMQKQYKYPSLCESTLLLLPGLLGPSFGLVLLDLPLGRHGGVQNDGLLLLDLSVAADAAQPQLHSHHLAAN